MDHPDVGLQIMDISDPADPRLLGSVALPGHCLDVKVAGAFAYAATHADGLQVIDVSDPSLPTIVGSVSATGNNWELAAANGHAYSVYRDYSTNTSAVEIIDLTDPAAPTITSETPLPGSGFGGTIVHDDHVYVGTDAYGVQIVDVAPGRSPALVGVAGTPTSGRALVIRDDLLYTALRRGGVMVHDIADPPHPVLLGTMASRGGGRAMATGDGYFLALLTTGLQAGYLQCGGGVPVMLASFEVQYVAAGVVTTSSAGTARWTLTGGENHRRTRPTGCT